MISYREFILDRINEALGEMVKYYETDKFKYDLAVKQASLLSQILTSIDT